MALAPAELRTSCLSLPGVLQERSLLEVLWEQRHGAGGRGVYAV